LKSNVFDADGKKKINVEFDDDAYFETVKKHKKKVEFHGFDTIWHKINNL
jgi:hypothetical protein